MQHRRAQPSTSKTKADLSGKTNLNGKGLVPFLNHSEIRREAADSAAARHLVPFLNHSEIRREAADSAAARQGEVTTYRNDLEMELLASMRLVINRAHEQQRINAQEIENLYRQRKLSGRQVKLPVADE